MAPAVVNAKLFVDYALQIALSSHKVGVDVSRPTEAGGSTNCLPDALKAYTSIELVSLHHEEAPLGNTSASDAKPTE